MKRLMVVLLLTLSAVVTIFTATSCKTMPVFGGPDMPEQKGVLFVDLGSGWEEVDSLYGEYVGMYINPQIFNTLGPNDMYNVTRYDRWENNPNKIAIAGNRIKVAYRLTEDDKTMENMVAMMMSGIVIQALDKKSEVIGSDSYTYYYVATCLNWTKSVPDVDLTNYNKGYAYKEFVVPNSPIGGYYLYLHNRLFRLEQR